MKEKPRGLDGDLIVRLVYDGSSGVSTPIEMGQAREDQLIGTEGEILSEVAARVCYDSLGKKRSRASGPFHEHLLGTKHGSVHEHYNRTFAIRSSLRYGEVLAVLINRPGLWVRHAGHDLVPVRVTMNIRNAYEWDRWTESDPHGHAQALGFVIKSAWSGLVPQLVKPESLVGAHIANLFFGAGAGVSLVEPEHDEERWISIYMSGSRGWSHEQVRHKFRTAVSQRSTRYVDESGSPWVCHPLLWAYLGEVDDPWMVSAIESTIAVSRGTYDQIVKKLESWLLARIPEGTPYRQETARKQARGAARGMLGNALQTEMIFSASVAQWRRMLSMRAADAADAEIRALFAPALPILKASRYGARFEDLVLAPASDGIGSSLQGGGAK